MDNFDEDLSSYEQAPLVYPVRRPPVPYVTRLAAPILGAPGLQYAAHPSLVYQLPPPPPYKLHIQHAQEQQSYGPPHYGYGQSDNSFEHATYGYGRPQYSSANLYYSYGPSHPRVQPVGWRGGLYTLY